MPWNNWSLLILVGQGAANDNVEKENTVEPDENSEAPAQVESRDKSCSDEEAVAKEAVAKEPETSEPLPKRLKSDLEATETGIDITEETVEEKKNEEKLEGKGESSKGGEEILGNSEKISDNNESDLDCPTKEKGSVGDEEMHETPSTSPSCASTPENISPESKQKAKGTEQEQRKPQLPLHPTIVDMLRKSTNELLHCLQRYYGGEK